MIKNRFFNILVIAILFNLFFANVSFALENTEMANKYPDYATSFVGDDKWENFNRKIFMFNIKANKYVFRPLTKIWASVMPQYGMDRIQNFYTNLNYPVRLFGCLFQNDYESAGSETKRFFINTTLGIAGLYDKASTKFNISPRMENIEQALAYHNLKQGPYVVLPLIAQGNTRDIAGQLLDLPLNPCSYIVGPVALASTGVSLMNDTTTKQPIYKMADEYADPYQVSKELFGINSYIKNLNIDRINVFEDNTESKNVVKINNSTDNSNLKADINLDNYNSQGALVDAMRTVIFDNQKFDKSKWSELSVWNKTFAKKIQTSSVRIDSTLPKYKYRYILQSNKTAPLAVIYPSIGEGIMSAESVVQAKLLYDAGYSVVIQGSSFQWEFVKSMPEKYRPGLPSQDAHYLKIITSLILNQLQNKYDCQFNKKILVGTSFGGLTGLYVAAQEENDKKLGNRNLGFSNYIFICPPIQIFFALQQIDKYSQDWKNNPADIKMRTAVATEKVMQVSQKASIPNNNMQYLPFTQDEAEIAIGYAMKLKLSDVVFTIEHGSRTKKSNIYDVINNMSFYDYAQKYLIPTQDTPIEQLNYDSSLYSLSDFLRKNKNYKIYHSLDDCFVNSNQLIWLKKQSGNKSIFFSNGSHLGFLYRPEFLNEFKNDIRFQNVQSNNGI